jgi:hypothetical protein
LCILKGFALARPFCWPIKERIERAGLPEAQLPTGGRARRSFAVSGDA